MWRTRARRKKENESAAGDKDRSGSSFFFFSTNTHSFPSAFLSFPSKKEPLPRSFTYESHFTPRSHFLSSVGQFSSFTHQFLSLVYALSCTFFQSALTKRRFIFVIPIPTLLPPFHLLCERDHRISFIFVNPSSQKKKKNSHICNSTPNRHPLLPYFKQTLRPGLIGSGSHE